MPQIIGTTSINRSIPQQSHRAFPFPRSLQGRPAHENASSVVWSFCVLGSALATILGSAPAPLIELENPVGILHQVLHEWINRRRIEQHRSILRSITQGVGDVLDHLGCIFMMHGIMLDDDERMVGLLQDGH